MSRGPDNDLLAQATAPRPDEVARVEDALAPGLAEACAAATTPTDAEQAELLGRLVRGPAPRTPALRTWGPALALAAALLLALWPPAYGPLPVDLGQALVLDGDPVQLGASISVDGVGAPGPTARLVQAGPAGTVVALESGTAWFDIRPYGQHRRLQVQAGDVRVTALGTRFFVAHQGGGVAVGVARGAVEVRADGATVTLRAGQRWTSTPRPDDTRPAPAVAVAPTPAPQLPTPEGVAAPPAEPSPAPAVVEQVPVEAAPAAPAPPQPKATDAALAFAAWLDRRERGASDREQLDGLDAFVSAHPDSALAEEARRLRLPLLARVHGDDVALAAAEQWLAARPADTDAASVHLLRGDLLERRDASCAAARASWSTAATLGSPDVAQAARTRLDACPPPPGDPE